MDVRDFKAIHQEPEGEPIDRIAKQLNALNALDTVIESELGVGVRTPGGVWDWLGGKRSELKNLGRALTNRDVRLFYGGANVVKSHKLRQVIESHCAAVDLITQYAVNEADFSKMSLAKSREEWMDT